MLCPTTRSILSAITTCVFWTWHNTNSLKLTWFSLQCSANIDVEYIYVFVMLGGVCKASRWRHCATVPAHRHACARNTVTLQLKDGGYALLWKRYNNNNMAAIRYYGNVMTWTKWRLCVAMKTLWQQQNNKYGRYAILWKRYDRCILHLQQYSRRLNLFFFICSFSIQYKKKYS